MSHIDIFVLDVTSFIWSTIQSSKRFVLNCPPLVLHPPNGNLCRSRQTHQRCLHTAWPGSAAVSVCKLHCFLCFGAFTATSISVIGVSVQWVGEGQLGVILGRSLLRRTHRGSYITTSAKTWKLKNLAVSLRSPPSSKGRHLWKVPAHHSSWAQHQANSVASEAQMGAVGKKIMGALKRRCN